jgi:hypothetical protein
MTVSDRPREFPNRRSFKEFAFVNAARRPVMRIAEEPGESPVEIGRVRVNIAASASHSATNA